MSPTTFGSAAMAEAVNDARRGFAERDDLIPLKRPELLSTLRLGQHDGAVGRLGQSLEIELELRCPHGIYPDNGALWVKAACTQLLENRLAGRRLVRRSYCIFKVQDDGIGTIRCLSETLRPVCRAEKESRAHGERSCV